MLQRPLIILLILMLWVTASSSTLSHEVEVSSLLENIRTTYRNLKSYRFDADLVTEVTTGDKKERTEMAVSLSIIKPARVRVQIKDEQKDLLTISNEQTTWVYMDHLKQYVKTKTVSAHERGTSEVRQAGMADRLLDAYASLVDQAGNSRILREEEVEIEGKAVPCYVLMVAASSDAEGVAETDRTLWIDKNRYVVLKEISHSKTKPTALAHALELTRTTMFTRVDINQSLPPDLFVFQPPEGARQVENFDVRAAGNLIRSEAPDFTLKDLDGHSFNLKSQRGKAVLIEFWASWCGPCRFEMPLVEKLHRHFQRKGLVVVGVNDEDPEAAQEFLQDKDFTFPMLVDVSGEVGSAYNVNAIPTLVLIDQEGNLVHRDVGLGNDRRLRESLQKIGFDTHDLP